MIWYDIIWYHIIWYDIIWYHITAAAAAAAAAAALRCKGRRETFFRNFTLKNDLQKIEKYKKDPHENSVHFPYWIITRWYGFVPVMMNSVFDKNCIIISYLYFISYHHFLILGVVGIALRSDSQLLIVAHSSTNVLTDEIAKRAFATVQLPSVFLRTCALNTNAPN